MVTLAPVSLRISTTASRNLGSVEAGVEPGLLKFGFIKTRSPLLMAGSRPPKSPIFSTDSLMFSPAATRLTRTCPPHGPRIDRARPGVYHGGVPECPVTQEVI